MLHKLGEGNAAPEDLTGPDGILVSHKRALIERAVDAEMKHHLGYDTGGPRGPEQPNRRKGRSSKRVRTDDGPREA